MPKNKHNERVGSSVSRSDDRIKATGEVFTPMDLCRVMVSDIPLETLQDPSATFLDPSAGSGNFLVALKERLTQYHSEAHVVNHMIYSVELMEDNHRELCARMGVATDHPHYVNADALKYDYSFGEDTSLGALSGLVCQ